MFPESAVRPARRRAVSARGRPRRPAPVGSGTRAIPGPGFGICAIPGPGFGIPPALGRASVPARPGIRRTRPAGLWEESRSAGSEVSPSAGL